MRYHALACDYDGTIAHHGTVDERTIQVLEEVRRSGRKVLLVTGRELDDLMRVFPRIDIFDRIVAENGALIYRPATRDQRLLAEAPPPEFGRELIRRGAERVSLGQVIVATWEPHETTSVELIRDMGLELQVIFNKGAVMILPSGVNKATGLTAALLELGLSAHNVVGVGDAENDHAFLNLCECSVAVSNALPTLKERVDWVAKHDHGKGTVELAEALIASDLNFLEHRLRHRVVLGKRSDGSDVFVSPYGVNVLVAGTSGAGKSTFATGFLERLEEQNYQFVIVDPEGDYSTFEGGVVVGDKQSPPSVAEVLDLLSKPDQNAAANLIGVALTERPSLFDGLMSRLQELRVRTGRPHWVIVDEAHHVLPFARESGNSSVSSGMSSGFMFVTLEPDRLSPAVLSSVDFVVAVGENPDTTLQTFARSIGQPAPSNTRTTLKPGEVLGWFRRRGEEPFLFTPLLPRAERRRHRRKYAEGELTPDLCFYFKGPEGKLNLRAQNLSMFIQMAEGVDNETWQHHLENGDIAGWFRNVIKDPELAHEAERIEGQNLPPAESRQRIRRQIEERYIVAA